MPLSNTEEMAAIRQRFGKPTLGSAIYLAFVSLAMNAYLLYLVSSGEASRVGIALYGVLELIAYSLIANATMAAVPKELRVGSPDMPVSRRIVAIAVISAMLCGIAWLGVHGDSAHLDMLRQSRNPLGTLAELNVLKPLALTIAFAVSGSFVDWWRWRGSGRPFVSGLALSATPKFLTAVIAPIVALLFADDIRYGERATFIWCSIYLAIKCGLELFFVYWQYRGMPEGKQPASKKQR
jgi:hypothetical protein